MKLEKILLAVSFLILLFYIFLFSLSDLPEGIRNFVLVGVFVEILTFPLMFLTLVLFVFSLFKIIKKDKNYLLVFLTNLLTVGMLVWKTYQDFKV